MDVQQVLTMESRPGLFVAGNISSGVAKVGDSLVLMEGHRAVGEVSIEAIEMLDFQIGGPEPSSLVTLRVSGVDADAVVAGQVLRSS
jgi:GTPase